MRGGPYSDGLDVLREIEKTVEELTSEDDA
jgi:hypothetical protein